MKHLQMFAIGRSLNSGFEKRREKNEKKVGKEEKTFANHGVFTCQHSVRKSSL